VSTPPSTGQAGPSRPVAQLDPPGAVPSIATAVDGWVSPERGIVTAAAPRGWERSTHGLERLSLSSNSSNSPVCPPIPTA